MRDLPRLLPIVLAGTLGCRVLSSALPSEGLDASGSLDVGGMEAADSAPFFDAALGIDVAEQPGIPGTVGIVGCADGTREGFRDFNTWQDIAGCAGGFSVPGLLGGLQPSCGLQGGDTGPLPGGAGCSAADLCAPGWHLCKDATDLRLHSPSSGCEGAVAAGEPRFFLVAAGASPMGICSPDQQAVNDLHGCGGLGEPESPDCSPLTRRMGFADCLATGGIWSCGTAEQSLEEAAIVTKTGSSLGGVLCCRG